MSVNIVNKSTGSTTKIAGTSQGEVGNLSLLDTEDKSCLVNAINEVKEDLATDVATLQSNFQAGVDSVYDAIVTKGTTPASKSLSDVVAGVLDIETIHSTTFTASNRASNLDMGETHSYRYVDTTAVPNSNSGTYSVDSNGLKDMGATNSYRYVNVNVPHPTHTTTYKPTNRASNNDMGATHLYRYVDTTAVPNSNSGTYTPTTRAASIDMGSTNSYRYVTTTSVPNSNSTTYSATSNGVKDMGATNNYRYVNVQVPNSNSGTYTPTSRASNLDMGAANSYRYVNTNSVPNSNSATYTYASGSTGGTVDMGNTNSYRYVNATNVYNKGKEDERNNLDIRVWSVGADGQIALSGHKLINSCGFDFSFTGGSSSLLYESGDLKAYKHLVM